MPRLEKNTFNCIIMPYWAGDNLTALDLVKVNILEYNIVDRYYGFPTYPFTLRTYSDIKTVIKKRGVDLTYSVISNKGRANGTNVYACTEGDPLPLIEELLNKRYKLGWSIKKDKKGSKVFYDYGLQP